MVKEFIEHLGIKILHTDGKEYICQCPICNREKFSINILTGLWQCFHGCGTGNPYTLLGRTARITGREAFKILEQFGLGTDVQPAVSVVKKPDKVIDIKPDDIIDLPLLDQLIFCDAKKLDRQALLKFEPKRYKKQPIVLLPAFSPENLTQPVGYIRVALDGAKIPIKFKNFDGSWGEKLEKYPVVKGSSPGLVGLPEALKDSSGTIIYAEGWKDAHAAISQGYISVCNSQGAKTWKDEWLSVFEGKIVYIIFDRDKAGVDGGNKAAERIATVAKEVYLVELPYEYTETSGKDLYDYLMVDNQDFPLLLKNAPAYIPTPPSEPERDFIMLDDDGADTMAKSFRQYSIDNCGVLHRYHPYDGWTIYKDNQYQKVDATQQIAKYISNYLSNCWFVKGKNHVRVKLTNAKIKDVITQFSYLDDVYLKPSQKSPCWLDGRDEAENILAAKNCLINLDNGQTYPLTKDFYTTNYLPYDYNPDYISDKWGNFLCDITNNDVDVMLLLQMWCGYLFIPNQQYQSFLLCVGDGANGKGVFFDTIANVVGRHNTSNLPLAFFHEMHKVYGTYGKIANMSNETAKNVEANIESVIKEYTGNDVMYWKKIYQDGFNAKPTAKLMFSTNELPVIRDTTDGIWRRMIYVPFDAKFPASKQNKNLANELQNHNELSGILNWMLEGRKMLIKNKGFVLPDRCQQALNQYRTESNSVLGFITDTISEDVDSEISTVELYNIYKAWCINNGCYAKNNVHFGKELHRQFPNMTKLQRLNINGHRVNNYIGITCGISSGNNTSHYTNEDYEAL